MRIEAYLRIVGDESTIRTIAKETKITSASIKQTKAKKDDAGGEFWWNWQTTPVPIDAQKTDEGLRALLLAHRSISPTIKKHEAEVDIYLEVVTYYQDGDEPSGLYLSSETIQLLSELSAALDNDVVRDLTSVD